MLDIRKQVCSYMHAMALWNAGIQAPAAFYWTQDGELVPAAAIAPMPDKQAYAAYMPSEMGRIMPERIFNNFIFGIGREKTAWIAFYASGMESLYTSYSRMLSDAIAMVILCLARNGHINPEARAA